MYHEYTQDELRSYCRSSIENLEIWARRLIDEQMVKEYGKDYINHKENDEFIIKKDIRNHIIALMDKEPARCKRIVDTLFIDQIIYFLCNPKWYKKLFKPALDYVYPQGRDEAREFLNRLVPIRNPLSHANPISLHDVERVICYSHDFVEGLKNYYKDRGEEQVWNVPRIIKIKDSFGNVFTNQEDGRYGGSDFVLKQSANCGDKYSVEVEVDPSFSSNKYTLDWYIKLNRIKSFHNKNKFDILFSEEDVGMRFRIVCQVISNNAWHKYGYYDGEVSITLPVLPPIN